MTFKDKKPLQENIKEGMALKKSLEASHKETLRLLEMFKELEAKRQ